MCSQECIFRGKYGRFWAKHPNYFEREQKFLYPQIKNHLITSFRDGRPAPRGRGGSPPCPATRCGEGGAPHPARPAKMIKATAKLRGKIKAHFSIFSNRRYHRWWYNYTKLNNAQSSLSIGYICKRRHPLTPSQSNTKSYSCGLSLRESKKWKPSFLFFC